MVNSALINGIPGHINKRLLTDILKTELGFTGFIVTDWQDIENIAKRDRIATDNKDAVRTLYKCRYRHEHDTLQLQRILY
jgi:beta-glucosidase